MAVKQHSIQQSNIASMPQEIAMGRMVMKHCRAGAHGQSNLFLLALCSFCLICSVFLPTFSAETTAAECARVGDAMGQVLRYCGQPSWVDQTEETRQCVRYNSLFLDDGRRRWVTGSYLAPCVVQIEEWTYNFGPTRFVRILTFEDRILVNIRTGSYGY
ncbi:MAG: DUF2845 domain-containing protein [Syntrophobacteraceae bacterium]